jgi:predicted lipid-binding transport protein (Tim44 family)
MTSFDQHNQQVQTQYNAGRDINVYQPRLSLTEAERKRNRSRMLERVQAIWIDGVLEPSVQGAAQIALALENKPNAVVTPLWHVLREYDTTGRLSSADVSIVQVYNQANGEVLILGEPGAGKSTLLLELTRDLLERARRDETYPIPVVFNLSSWAQTRQPLAEWLASELATTYQVPRALATSWIETDQVLPLLDGLDEVAASHRDACVEAINTYRRAHGLLPTVVCCRQIDYLMLSTRLLLRTAVIVQPLTSQQVESYLANGGERLEALHQALQEDADLQTLATTPLMLKVLAVVYQGMPSEEIVATGSPGSKREQILATYVQRMLARRSISTRYTPTQTIHWLSWLAWQMKRHNQAEFYLERMQPDWLEEHQSLRHAYRAAVRMGTGLLGGLVFGLLVGLVFGLLGGLRYGLLLGLPVGLGTGLLGGLVVGLTHRVEKEIKPAEVVIWSWKSMWQKLAKMESLRSALVGGLLSGLVFGLSSRLSSGLLVGLVFGLLVGLVSRTVSELLGSAQDKQSLPLPSQERRYSARNRVLVGLVGGLVVGLLSGLLSGLLVGLVFGLGTGLLSGLHYGLLVGLRYGLLGGLLGGLVVGLTHRVRKEVKPREIISWLRASIWRELMKSESLKYMLVFGLLGGLLVGLLVGLSSRLSSGLLFGLLFGLVFGPISGLIFEFIGGLIGGLSSDLLDRQILTKPNQGIQRSARNSILVGLIGGLVSGLLVGLVVGLRYGLVVGLLFGLLFGPISGLSIGLSNGGAASIQHAVLRTFLWRAGYTPWNYSRFLDHAAERILLRKVGGGYIFLHRLLLDYFAARETAPVFNEPTERRQASTPAPVSPSNAPSEAIVPAVLPALYETRHSLPCGHELRTPSARFCSICGAPITMPNTPT